MVMSSDGHPGSKPTNIEDVMSNATAKTTYIVISGEGCGEGISRKVQATDRGIKRILTKERCGGDRWARAFYRLNAHTQIGIDSESGEAREFYGKF